MQSLQQFTVSGGSMLKEYVAKLTASLEQQRRASEIQQTAAAMPGPPPPRTIAI